MQVFNLLALSIVCCGPVDAIVDVIAGAVLDPIIGKVMDSILNNDDSEESYPDNQPTCSHWSHWGTCSVTCGEGTQTRARTCPTGSPAHLEQSRTCRQADCPPPCKKTFVSDSNKEGSFQSPAYDVTDCEYIFKPLSDEAVIIRFTEFQLANEASNHLSLQEDVGSKRVSDFLRKVTYMGEHLPPPYVSSKALKMVYRTETKKTDVESHDDIVFRANFKFVRKDAHDGITCSAEGECWFSDDEDSQITGIVITVVVCSIVIICGVLCIVYKLRQRRIERRPLGDLPSRKEVQVLSPPPYCAVVSELSPVYTGKKASDLLLTPHNPSPPRHQKT